MGQQVLGVIIHISWREWGGALTVMVTVGMEFKRVLRKWARSNNGDAVREKRGIVATKQVKTKGQDQTRELIMVTRWQLIDILTASIKAFQRDVKEQEVR